MMSVKDWVLSQILSKSLFSSRPISASESFSSDDATNEELGNQAQTSNLMTFQVSSDSSFSSGIAHDNQAIPHSPSSDSPDELDQRRTQQDISETALQNDGKFDEKKLDPLGKVQSLQIKFFRLLHRFGMSPDSVMVLKVLHRIHLASLIRAEKSDLKRSHMRIYRARDIAREQELSGLPELDFSIKILVLGRSGVGKSSTINSILNQTMATTNAFQPATDHIQKLDGTIKGVKMSFIDTPGLHPYSTKNIKKNRKILYAVKRFIKRTPPDMILYFERLDLIHNDYNDLPLLKLIGEIFGSSIWFNTVLVMTHASSTLPEGTNGYPINYESFVTCCSEVVQHYIHVAVSDTQLVNPVILVENHPQCRTNNSGDKITPNGQAWRSQFFLLCLCTKVLSDVNIVLDFEDSMQMVQPRRTRLPSLPHLLSSFLNHHHSRSNVNDPEKELDEILLKSDPNEEDEYDKLPPINMLSKAQFEKLDSFQRGQYLDELDYRETLYLKKQLREEIRRKKETLPQKSNQEPEPEPEPYLLRDMAFPPSFDPCSPVHRYRCLVSNDQWLARPVLDPHGWDHDIGFDGVNLEAAVEIQKNVYSSLAGQLSKDKKDFSLQSECLAAFASPTGTNYSLSFDIQSTGGREYISTIHSNVKIRNIERNLTECGISLTSFGDKCFLGTKLEDTMLIGKRMKLGFSGGRMAGVDKVAYGGGLEATIRGRDYPMRNDKISVGITVLSFENESVFGGNFQSDFRLTRGTKVTVNGNLNSRSMGRISLKSSSSDHMEVCLIAVISVIRGLFRRKVSDFSV